MGNVTQYDTSFVFCTRTLLWIASASLRISTGVPYTLAGFMKKLEGPTNSVTLSLAQRPLCAPQPHSTSARADCTRPAIAVKIGVARAMAFFSVCPGNVFINTFTAATRSPFQSCNGRMTITEWLFFP